MYERYAKLRDEKGYTDYRIAKETGISTQVISKWKLGRSVPKYGRLKKIADFFGVSVDYFYT